MDQNSFIHSLEGTPQGGIVSPLLFNIYMLELDKFVFEEIITPIIKENKEKKNEIVSSRYNKARYQKAKALNNYRAAKENFKLSHSHSHKIILKETKKILKQKILNGVKIPYGDHKRTKKGAIFVRYTDDWVLAITGNKTQAKKIKNQIFEFLDEKLQMKLDDNKTQITSYSKGFKFLGFEIRMETRKPKLMRILIQTTREKKERILRRTTSRNITVEPDSKKILKRLKELKMFEKNYFPIGKPVWYSYSEFQIAQKYAQIMRSIFNYYKACKKLSRLYHISYILKFSCAKTIAGRKKISMPKVFKRYGKDLIIQEHIKGQKENKTITQKFYDIITLRAIEKKTTSNFATPTPDPFRIQEHWRTKFKIYNEYCICGLPRMYNFTTQTVSDPLKIEKRITLKSLDNKLVVNRYLSVLTVTKTSLTVNSMILNLLLNFTMNSWQNSKTKKKTL